MRLLGYQVIIRSTTVITNVELEIQSYEMISFTILQQNLACWFENQLHVGIAQTKSSIKNDI